MRSRRCGMVLLDAVIGMAVVAVLLTGLVIAASQHRGVGQALAEQRELVRSAEAAATAMQAGHADEAPEGIVITVRELDDAAPTGRRWVLIRAERGERFAELTALTPTEAP